MRRFLAVLLALWAASAQAQMMTGVGPEREGAAAAGAMMKAPIFTMYSGASNFSGSATTNFFAAPVGLSITPTGAALVTVAMPVPVAGTFTNMSVKPAAFTAGTMTFSAAYGANPGITPTVPGSGALSVPLASASVTSDTTNAVTVTAPNSTGCDTIAFQAVGSGWTATQIAFSTLWTSTVGQEAPIFTVSSATTNGYVGFGTASPTSPSTDAAVSTIMPVAGTIDRLCVIARLAPSGGTTTITLVHDTGTNCGTSTPTALSVSWTGTNLYPPPDLTHSETFAAGDCASFQITSGVSTVYQIGVRWRPTVNNQYPLFSLGTTFSTATATTRLGSTGGSQLATQVATTSENSVATVVPPLSGATMTIGNEYVLLNVDPNSGATRQFSFRKNATNTTPSCTITGNGTTGVACNNNTTSTVAAGDLISVTNITNATAPVTGSWFKHSFSALTQ